MAKAKRTSAQQNVYHALKNEWGRPCSGSTQRARRATRAKSEKNARYLANELLKRLDVPGGGLRPTHADFHARFSSRAGPITGTMSVPVSGQTIDSQRSVNSGHSIPPFCFNLRYVQHAGLLAPEHGKELGWRCSLIGCVGPDSGEYVNRCESLRRGKRGSGRGKAQPRSITVP